MFYNGVQVFNKRRVGRIQDTTRLTIAMMCLPLAAFDVEWVRSFASPDAAVTVTYWRHVFYGQMRIGSKQTNLQWNRHCIVSLWYWIWIYKPYSVFIWEHSKEFSFQHFKETGMLCLKPNLTSSANVDLQSWVFFTITILKLIFWFPFDFLVGSKRKQHRICVSLLNIGNWDMIFQKLSDKRSNLCVSLLTIKSQHFNSFQMSHPQFKTKVFLHSWLWRIKHDWLYFQPLRTPIQGWNILGCRILHQQISKQRSFFVLLRCTSK